MHTFIAKNCQRLDKFLVEKLRSSRNQVEKFIKKGLVEVDGKVVTKPGLKLKDGQKVVCKEPPIQKQKGINVDFDVDIIYEDEDILVVNKPSGIVVHPAPSVKDATLVDWLKAKDIALSTLSGEERHGIVHRIDKETSGLLVIAKNNFSHASLAAQLQDKSMGRYYLAIIEPPLKEDIIVDRPIGRNPKNRLKMGVVVGAKEAKSAFAKLAFSKNKKQELIAAKLFTGRTHQIRVHLASLQRHIVGDSLYGFKSKQATIPRIFLHAYILYLYHPTKRKKMHFVAPIPHDMQEYLKKNFQWENVYEKINPDTFEYNFDFSRRMWRTAKTNQT